MSKGGVMYCNFSDVQIKPGDIPAPHSSLTPSRAMLIRDEVKAGDYISIQNQNNLSEVLIYRKSQFVNEDPSIMRWDGVTTSYDWYDSIDKDVYNISNAEQLAGLAELVALGHTFEGKIIRLVANINLNNKEWTPIGAYKTSKDVNVSGDIYHKVELDNKVFSGIFDGQGFTIYGLKMVEFNPDARFAGLFGALRKATVRNLIFHNVKIGSCVKDSSYAALCGYAESCSFFNVVVSGVIRGEKCSSVCCVAVDSSFYKCVNRATLIGKSDEDSTDITIGGIVQQISLSDNLVSIIHQKEPAIFIKCVQTGDIIGYVKGASHFWAGQLYGCLAHNPKSEHHGIIIERCDVRDDIEVHDLDTSKTKAVFFGKKDGSPYASNYGHAAGDKVDLLNGLLGKTYSGIIVNVLKVTGSTIIDNIVFPGSVNMLRSDSYTNSFITVDTNPILDEDGIANLSPYFEYVKTASM